MGLHVNFTSPERTIGHFKHQVKPGLTMFSPFQGAQFALKKSAIWIVCDPFHLQIIYIDLRSEETWGGSSLAQKSWRDLRYPQLQTAPFQAPASSIVFMPSIICCWKNSSCSESIKKLELSMPRSWPWSTVLSKGKMIRIERIAFVSGQMCILYSFIIS